MDSSIQKLSGDDLVEACLAGDDQAWKRLAELIQRLSLFRVYGGKYSEQAEETADQVFFALWWNDCQILRGFKPEKGALESYLTAVLKHFAQQAKRLAQRERRKLSEYAGRRAIATKPTHEETRGLVLEEFSNHLRGELKRYFQQKYLGVMGNEKGKDYSQQNAWKLDQRLRDEWRRFFAGE